LTMVFKNTIRKNDVTKTPLFPVYYGLQRERKKASGFGMDYAKSKMWQIKKSLWRGGENFSGARGNITFFVRRSEDEEQKRFYVN